MVNVMSNLNLSENYFKLAKACGSEEKLVELISNNIPIDDHTNEEEPRFIGCVVFDNDDYYYNIEEKLGRAGVLKKQMEGYDTANWVLIDYRDIIVHIFDKENRLFYDLERIWRDGKTVSIEEIA